MSWPVSRSPGSHCHINDVNTIMVAGQRLNAGRSLRSSLETVLANVGRGKSLLVNGIERLREIQDKKKIVRNVTPGFVLGSSSLFSRVKNENVSNANTQKTVVVQ